MRRHIVRAYWPSFRKYWLLWVGTVVAMLINVSLQALSPYYMRGVVDTLTSSTPNAALAWHLFGIIVWCYVGIVVSYRVFDLCIALHEGYALTDLDIRTFGAIQRQSLRFFEDTYSGSLITQARRFRSSYETITDLFFFQFGRNAVMLVVISVAFLQTMPKLAGPFMAWTLVFLIYCAVTTKWKYKYDKAASENDSAVGAALADSLTNHLTVKTFGQEKAEEQRFRTVLQKNHWARLRSWLLGDVIMIGQVLVVTTAELFLIGWLINGWTQGTVTAGEFVFVQTYLAWAVGQLWSFGHNLRKLFTAIADAEEMADIHHLAPEVQDAAGAYAIFINDGTVEIHAVNFRYGGPTASVQNAISDLSLIIPTGQAVGLVGRSGAGKSTLVKLLLRFYDLDSGYIRIDGQDIANVTQVSLRQQLAVVPQHPQLFHRSIRDNIAFARIDATDEEIIHAAKQAHAWEFIKDLPQGLDTLVGERGVKLSGGQQQRVAIARAILADPKILILDEATSSLDSTTEKEIQQAISNLLRGRTAIVIAHRLSTIMELDRIIVLTEGRIIEDGTHDELLELGGIYADLWTHQSGGYIN